MGVEDDLKEYDFYTYQTNSITSGFSVSDLELYETIDSLDLGAELVYTSWVYDSLEYTIIGAVAIDSADDRSEMSMGIFYNGQAYMVIPQGFMKLE
jgi:hypothetical protein